MLQEVVRKLINSRQDKPCQVIPGYSDKPQPPKPFSTMYLLNHKRPDIYDRDVDDINEHMSCWGEFTFQFDSFGNTDLEAREIAEKLRDLITYKMRYSDLISNNIGIANEDISIKCLNEKNDKEYIFRYSFDLTLESEITLERIAELAETIELNANEKKYEITNKGGK